MNTAAALLLAAAMAPPGWFTGGDGYAVSLEGNSIRIENVAPGSAGFAMRFIPREEVDGQWVRVSAAIRAEDVEGYAGLFLRFDRGDEILYLDNMRDRGVSGTADRSRHGILARIPDGADRVVYGALLMGGGTAWFDAFFVEELTDAQVPDPPDEVVAYIERALNLIERHALYADRLDREAILGAARGAQDLAGAHAVLRGALTALGDRHSRLMPPREARDWDAGPPAGERPMPSARWLVPGEIAYIELPRFDGTDAAAATLYADTVQRAIAAHAARGWVVDLRGNSGGNMWPMLAGIGPLLDTGRPGAFEGAHGQRAWWWYRDGAAGVGDTEGARISGAPVQAARRPAVALLTGPTTASSGEAIALAFAGQVGTRRFGYETAGLTTGNQQFILSDGAIMWLATSRFVDRKARAYDGALPPDERVIPTGRPRAEDPVLEAAVRWLRTAGRGSP